jgi:radical SAM protein with 4Fe4S-binding SPASM domain
VSRPGSDSRRSTPAARVRNPVRRLNVYEEAFRPVYVVWELTLACDHACTHCGSRAGKAREDELTTDEALRVVGELAELGVREVVLVGGEAYLHEGFVDITRALSRAGVRPTLTTGGLGIDDALARQMADAGMQRVSVSIDGLAVTHDRMRNKRGSFAAATAALERCRRAGLVIAANTNVNRTNRHDLEALYDHLRDAGVGAWQVQITSPLGRAADRPDMMLQPFDLLELLPRIAELKRRGLEDGLTLMPGNNLGYFGPEEALLRSQRAGGKDHWAGCQAGRYVLGIESDGAVKGCPSLQTAAYVGGNLRREALREVWEGAAELAFARARTEEDLWGFCRTCPFAATCLGGCSFTAHAVFGRPGNNPYCHYRARTLAKQGQRERLVAVRPAPGRPFDHGLFELVVEALDAADPAQGRPPEDLVAIRRRSPRAPSG